MLVRQVLPLFLAYAGEQDPIEGRTRLQKMLFLLQQSCKDCNFQYKFNAYDYGPYSSTLQSDLDMLIDDEYLKEDSIPTIDGKLKYRYSITEKGARLVEGLLKDRKHPELRLAEMYDNCEKLKNAVNHLNLNELLKDIYTKYPEYAKFSIFKF